MRRVEQSIRSFTPAPAEGATRVVLVHPGALPVAGYADLAVALGADVELNVVDLEQVPEYRQLMLAGGEPEVSADGLAAVVGDRLRERGLFDGRWLLAGWSVGGVVSYALTSLLAEHELPDHLVLLDTIAPVPGYHRTPDDFTPEVLLSWFVSYLAAKRGGSLNLPEGCFRGVDTESGLQLVLEAAIASGVLWPDTALSGLRKVYQVYLFGLFRNVDLTKTYQPGPARVPMTLVRPRRGLLDTPNPLGWEGLSADLTVARCAGDHYSMLRDPLAVARVSAVIRESKPVHVSPTL